MSAPKPNVLHNIDACVFGEQRADSKNLLLPSAIKTMAKYMGGWPRMPLFYGVCLPSSTKGTIHMIMHYM